MTALLSKDARLSLDTLLPWALIVAGFAIFGAAMSFLPETLVPEAMSTLSLADLLFGAAILVGGTAPMVAAWLAASVAQGDRLHGAEHLVAALPVSPWRVAASKLCVIALGAALLALVATMCLAASFAAGDRLSSTTDELRRWVMATSAASFTGAALGLGVSAIVRGPFRVVAIAMLLGAVAGLVGLWGSWLSFDRAASGLVEFARHQPWGLNSEFTGALDEARTISAIIAAIAGMAITALAALGVGIVALARPLRSRRVVAFLGAGLALALAAGATATFASFDVPAGLRQTNQWAQWRLERMDDADLLATFDATRSRTASPDSFSALHWSAPVEIRARLARIDPSLRSGHPLMKALLAAQDSSTEQRALATVSLLPVGPERVDRTLDAVRRYPHLREWFLSRLVWECPEVEGRETLRHLSGEERQRQFKEVATRTLLALQEAYPAQRDAIQGLLDQAQPLGSR